MIARMCFAVLLVMLSGCGSSGRGMAPRAPAEQPPHAEARPVVVYAPPVLAPLMERLGAGYEAAVPGVDVRVTTVGGDDELDAMDEIVRRVNGGEAADVIAAESARALNDLAEAPLWRGAWAGNRLVVVAGRGTGLRMVDMSKGRVAIGVALERSALGAWTRSALEERGVWRQASDRVAYFDDAGAILRRIGERREAMLGVVYATEAARAPVRVVGWIEPARGERVEHALAAFSAGGVGFVEWLMGEHAARIAREAGLTPVKHAP